MFHPHPDAEHSVDGVIAELTGALVGVPNNSPRAPALTEMILGPREIAKERRAVSAAPSAEIDRGERRCAQ